MHGYNNFINLEKKKIYNYEISIIFDDTQDYILDLYHKIDLITSVTNIFNKSIKYFSK